MALKATLVGIDVEDLIRFVANAKMTGTLALASASSSGSLEFAAGSVASAHMDRRGTTTDSAAIEETVFELFESGIGEAAFLAEELTDDAEPGRSVDAEQLLGRVAELGREWRQLREIIPAGNSVLALRREEEGVSEKVTLDSKEWVVVCELGQPATVELLYSRLGVSALSCWRLLANMVEKGVVRVLPEAAQVPSSAAEIVASQVEASEVQAEEPADLLVKGVTDVLEEVTAEMEDIEAMQAHKRRPFRRNTVETLEDVPPEWSAYYERLADVKDSEDVAGG